MPDETIVTSAALSDHRFERPIDPDDDFQEIPLIEQDLDLMALKGQAEEQGLVRVHEVRKRYPVPERMSPERDKALARQILGLLSMARYRRGPVKFIQDASEEFIAKLVHCIQRDIPVEIILSFFCYKVCNPLKTWAQTGTEVDLSELGSLLRFHELAFAISQLYPPGAKFLVACDGSKYYDSVGFPAESGRGYFENVRGMAEYLGISGSTVELFDESSRYPTDIADRKASHTERVTEAYQRGDPDLVRRVTSLRTSMALLMPIDQSTPLELVALAFSGVEDAELQAVCAEAYDLRRDILDQAHYKTLRYIGSYDAVQDAGVLEEIAPLALRATVHPKPGQIGMYSVNCHANNIFPHHAQGTTRAFGRTMCLEDIRLKFAADLRRQCGDSPLVGVTLPKGRYPFNRSTESHPFAIVKAS